MLTKQTLNIFLPGARAGDAITTQALQQQRWLRGAGYQSHIYAESADATLAKHVRNAALYRPTRSETHVIYHHSAGSKLVDKLIALQQQLILVYHNVTPARFFTYTDPAWAVRAVEGRAQLRQLRDATALALAVSGYNAAELREVGFNNVQILPICVDPTRLKAADDPPVIDVLKQSDSNLLFVGRLAPNKRQEDLVKLLVYLKRIRPQTRLHLVGDRWTAGTDRWVEQLASQYNMQDAVTLTGKVSDAALATYYRHSQLYVSMSAHEGFGKPLIESMFAKLPIIAYASSGVPDTLGDAGILFRDKRWPELAELVNYVLDSAELRARLIGRQTERVQQFLEPVAQETFLRYLELI